LPGPVYALISGLNAGTVGIIILAAVQLSQKAITDKLSRILVFLGGAAGMLYNALWYFPILMILGGVATIIWDYRWGHRVYRRVKIAVKAEKKGPEAHAQAIELGEVVLATPLSRQETKPSNHSRRESSIHGTSAPQRSSDIPELAEVEEMERVVPPGLQMRIFSWRFGISIITSFFGTFIAVMVLRATLKSRTRGFNLFANLYLAG
jgi:hypothetical protein